MKLLVDARELGGYRTGVGRYLLQLLRRWAAQSDAATREIVLCAPHLPDEVCGLGFRTICDRGSGGTAWEQIRLPWIAGREAPDVLFCPGYTAPLLSPVPTVVTIHDISFATHPEWFSLREGLRRRALTRWSARRARAVITVSDFSASEIAGAYGLHRSGIHVVHHGVEHLPAQAGVAREALVLFVGSIFNRRHVPELIEAVARVRTRVGGLRLAVVGENRTEPRQDLPRVAAAHGIADAVDLADYVPDDRLALLYARARVFAFVSDYEGFGLTPLEALAAGVPVVVADTAVARETCGDAALYVPAGDVNALAAAIEHLLRDDDMRARVLREAQSVLARYSWERAAADTLRVLKEAGRS